MWRDGICDSHVHPVELVEETQEFNVQHQEIHLCQCEKVCVWGGGGGVAVLMMRKCL